MDSGEYMRLLGARDGLSHALMYVGSVKQSLTGPANAYLPPKRHNRKRQNVENKIAVLDKVSEIIQHHLDDVKRALANIPS